ncbi:unnamed protein product [Linum tenue]|uniref:Glycine-rich protein n=1 Tax=Linum tenue TaxID=586396 RepID=A0AAV0Q1A5_9ROSI|nr:unnamed protein product [Linum tenue]
MQGGRGGGDPFFGFGGDPFAGFGGFGGFGGRRSMLPGLFDGRNPFDDPFFTCPFGGMFESSIFGPHANPFAPMHPPTYIEHQAPVPNRSQGPTIEELESDDEKQDADKERKENSRKHGRSGKGPYVEEVDDEAEGRQRKQLMAENRHNSFSRVQSRPQSQSFVFQSSSVSYGGAGGTYYTSSKTRRTGNDGVTFEESKEADSSTGIASHRISRGLHNKGHTVARKLNSDGNVDSQQILHNIEQDELASFEQAWNGSAGPHLPGWGRNFSGREDMRAIGSGQNHSQTGRGGWALPSTERPKPMIGRSVVNHPVEQSGSSRRQDSGKAKHVDGREKHHHSSGWGGRD